MFGPPATYEDFCSFIVAVTFPQFKCELDRPRAVLSSSSETQIQAHIVQSTELQHICMFTAVDLAAK